MRELLKTSLTEILSRLILPLIWVCHACFVINLPGVFAAGSNGQPNILWLSCEDIGPHIGVYGDSVAKTPHIDRLAKRGITFTNAYTVAGVCAPNRSSVISGLYASTLGTQNMRSGGEGVSGSSIPEFPQALKTLPQILQAHGYYCTNNGKEDYNFIKPARMWHASGSDAHWKNRNDNQPFFAVFNYKHTHEFTILMSDDSFTKIRNLLTESEYQDPAQILLPPYYPDTPVVRKSLSRYYEAITCMDKWVNDRIEELKTAGLMQNTIVFFWSDHGAGMPRAKRWIYDSGIKIPLIVYIPDSMKSFTLNEPGTFSKQPVSSLDLAPTVLTMAGIDIPVYFQGQPFVQGAQKRQEVYAIRDRMDERYEVIRAVRGERYKYIKNFTCDKPYFQYMQSAEKSPIMQEMRKSYDKGELPEPGKQYFTPVKPPEELYDTLLDPAEVNNLAGDPDFEEILVKFRIKLYQHMLQTRDLGLIPEPELVDGAQKSTDRFTFGQSLTQEFLQNLLSVAAVAGRPGADDIEILKSAIKSKDAAIRYWGLRGMGNYPDKIPASLVSPLLEDSVAFVRLEAVNTCLTKDIAIDPVSILSKELTSENEWIRLQAAIIADEHPTIAAKLQVELEQMLNDKDNKYVVRVANHIVNKLNGTKRIVR